MLNIWCFLFNQSGRSAALGQRRHVAVCIRYLYPGWLALLSFVQVIVYLWPCDKRQTTCHIDQNRRKFNFPFKKRQKWMAVDVMQHSEHQAACMPLPEVLKLFKLSAVWIRTLHTQDVPIQIHSVREVLQFRCHVWHVSRSSKCQQDLGNQSVSCQWRFFDMFFLRPSTPESHKLQDKTAELHMESANAIGIWSSKARCASLHVLSSQEAGNSGSCQGFILIRLASWDSKPLWADYRIP